MLQEAREVCPTSTRRLITAGALLVDVREPEELTSCAFDVPAVVNIPLSELEQRWSEVPKDREVVLVCHVGERSLKATYFLQYHGYTNVSNMAGGLAKWVRKGFPVTGQLATDSGTSSASCCCGHGDESARKTSCC